MDDFECGQEVAKEEDEEGESQNKYLVHPDVRHPIVPGAGDPDVRHPTVPGAGEEGEEIRFPAQGPALTATNPSLSAKREE